MQERFEALRASLAPGAWHILKVFSGIAAAIVVYALLAWQSDVLSHHARFTASVGALMAAWWVTEAIPLAATAILPVVLFPLAGIGTVDEVTARYADPIIFLFLGGFLIAIGLRRSGLHKRVALMIVQVIGVQPARLVGGFMLATATLSMWISNSATAVMMLTVGVSIMALIEQHVENNVDTATRERLTAQTEKFGAGLMLGIAYAATIGSFSTPISTPPNLFLIGLLEQNYGITVGFARWMAFGVPTAALLLALTWALLALVIYKPGFSEIPGGKEIIDEEVAKLGPMSPAERLVLVVFGMTAASWLLREPASSWDPLVERLPFITRVSDAGIALTGALLLFLIPYDWKWGETVMTWRAAREVPWDILVLFGGGLTLAAAISSTGLDQWIGSHLRGLANLPTLLLVIGVVIVVTSVTEVTTNTTTAATFLPIVGALAVTNGLDPKLLLVPATLAATCTFMLPVATPPNAVVYSSGYVTIPQMARAGVFLNPIAITVITLATLTLGRLVLGIEL